MSKYTKPILYVLWTIGCYYFFRWILYRYWAFDILNPQAWQELSYVWESGMVFPWLFVMSFVFAFPVLIIGYVIIKKVDFVTIVQKIITYPITMNKRRKIQHLAKKSIKIKKSKSYIETRPPALKPIMGEAYMKNPRKSIEAADIRLASQNNEKDDDFDMDRQSRRAESFDSYNGDRLPILGEPEDNSLEFLDKSPQQKSIESRNQSDGFESINELIESAGYKLLTDIKVGDEDVDYVAIANDGVILCFEENTQGDWLADEERFGNSEPLWFSETAQKVSPSSKAIRVRDKVFNEVSQLYPDITVVPVLIISNGKIINASDMIDTWEEMKIYVGRFGAGGPAELKKLSHLIPQNPEDSVDEEIVEKITQAIKSIK